MSAYQMISQNGSHWPCLSEHLSRKIDEAAKVIADSTEKYDSDEIFISFNGGKDCTVLLDLYMRFSKHEAKKPIIIYIQSDNPFEEVDNFIRTCEMEYGIEIRFIKGKLKATLEQLCSENPKLQAVVMGSRRTDPHCGNMNVYQYTDAGWPRLLRISPLLDWNYKDIWDYIRIFKIKYCKLYDEGYTSIGDIRNTKPNGHLLVKNSENSVEYRPAWELEDDGLERSGRI